MKHFATLIALLLSSVIFAQTTAIPDPNFENELIAQGIDTNGFTGDILDSDASGVSLLLLSSKGISSLEGIEAFTNLTFLFCDFNNLTQLDLRNNSNLTTLYCSNNAIDKIFFDNPNLNTLFCRSNQLKTIDLSSLRRLRILDLNNNQLEGALNVVLNIDLENLTCSYNNLETIKFNNSKLSYLECVENDIDAVNLSSLKSLELLNISNNRLKSLNISKNKSIEIIDCKNNQLSSLNVSLCSNLRELNCLNNNLPFISFSGTTALEVLEAGINEIKAIDVRNNINLEILGLVDNQITGTIDLLNNDALQSFNAMFNRIERVRLGTKPNLTYFEMTNNNLKWLDFTHCTALEHVGMSFNSRLFRVDLKNGNNTNITSFSALNIRSGAIICVDDVPYATANFTDVDTTTTFDTCSIGSLMPTPIPPAKVIYPSPFTDILHIDSESEVDTYEIYNLNGRKQTHKSHRKGKKIHVSDLNEGIYILKYSINGEWFSKKVIKK